MNQNFSIASIQVESEIVLSLTLKLLIIYSTNVYYPIRTYVKTKDSTFANLSKIWDTFVFIIKGREIDLERDAWSESRDCARNRKRSGDLGSPLCWANRLVCWSSTGYLRVASGPGKGGCVTRGWNNGERRRGRALRKTDFLGRGETGHRRGGTWTWNTRNTPLEVGRHGGSAGRSSKSTPHHSNHDVMSGRATLHSLRLLLSQLDR